MSHTLRKVHCGCLAESTEQLLTYMLYHVSVICIKSAAHRYNRLGVTICCCFSSYVLYLR